MADRRQFLSACGGALAAGVLPARVIGATAQSATALRVDATEWAKIPGLRALVLTGGVARGAYQAGVIEGLHDAGYTFDLVCGTSIGAINGALVAQNDFARLKNLWMTLASYKITRVKRVFEPVARPFKRRTDPSAGLINRTAIGEYIYAAAGAVESFASGGYAAATGVFDRDASDRLVHENLDVRRVAVPFAYVTTNINLERPEAFLIDPAEAGPRPAALKMDKLRAFADATSMVVHRVNPAAGDDANTLYWRSVRASGAFPYAFDPVPLTLEESDVGGGIASAKTYKFVDGGITANTPIALAYELGAQAILTIFCGPQAKPTEENLAHFTPADVAGSLVGTLMTRQITEDEFFVHQIDSKVRLFEIRPQADPPVAVFGFDDQAGIDKAYSQGYEDARSGPLDAGPSFQLRATPS